jgi:hypothetical protein
MSDEQPDIDLQAFFEALIEMPEPVLDVGPHKSVRIRRVTTVQLYSIIDLVKTLIEHFKIGDFKDLHTIATAMKDPAEFFKAVLQAYPRVVLLLQELTSLSREELNELELDHLLLVAMAVWRVNESFFSRRVSKLIPTLSLQKPATS